MIIKLKYEDLTAGVINSRTSDPLALAAQRAGMVNPRVGKRTISWEEPVPVLRDTVHAQWNPDEVGPIMRVFAPLPDNAVRILKRLTYEPREEILPCTIKRNKRGGDVTSISHKEIEILIGEGMVQES